VSIKLREKRSRAVLLTLTSLIPTFDPARILYNAKAHGYSAATFHQKCDQVNGTVTLVTLKNGAKFGGYNPDNWSGQNTSKNAPAAFLFSLTDGKGSAPQKFALKQSSAAKAVHGYPSCGPSFGAGLLSLLGVDSKKSI